MPFADMLVVFSVLEQEHMALQQRRGAPVGKEFTLSLKISTDFPDEEAARLLSGIRIETPFDKGKLLRLQAAERPLDEAGDDPQTPQ